MNQPSKLKRLLLSGALLTAVLTAHAQVAAPLTVSQRGLAYDLQPLGTDRFALVWVDSTGSHLCLLTTASCKDAGLPNDALAPRLVPAPQGLQVVWATPKGELFASALSPSGKLEKPTRLYTAPTGMTPLWGDQYGDVLVRKGTLHVTWLERSESNSAPLRVMRLKVAKNAVGPASQVGEMDAKSIALYASNRLVERDSVGARRLPAFYLDKREVLTVFFGKYRLNVETFQEGWDVQFVRESGEKLAPLRLGAGGFEVASDPAKSSNMLFFTRGVPKFVSPSGSASLKTPKSLTMVLPPYADTGGVFYRSESTVPSMLSQRDDGLILVAPRIGALDAHLLIEGDSWKEPTTLNSSDKPLETGDAFIARMKDTPMTPTGALLAFVRRNVPGPFLHSQGRWTVVGWTQGDRLSYRLMGPDKVWSPVARVGGASHAFRATGAVNDAGMLALVWSDSQSFEVKAAVVASPTRRP